MAQWYAIINSSSGDLISLGTVVADNLPPGHEKIALDNPPPVDHRWDAGTRSWVAIPPVVLIDRLQDFLDQPGVRALIQSLSAAQRNILQDGLIALLGRQRFRHPERSANF